ncbi:MAG: metallophosphoesterase [Dermatophilaceae bacterium]
MTRTIPRFAGGVFTLRMHYVVSDVHGHVEHLVAGLAQVRLVDSARSWCGGRARLTFLGDYFDRGPDGIAVVDLIRRLAGEAATVGGRVDALLGNHEILALGMRRFGDVRVSSEVGRRASFAHSWALNGGQVHDQQRLTDEHVGWLSGLDSITLAGQDLLLHSDTTEYLRWGDSFEQINDAVREVLISDDLEQWWECWARLTTRYAFADVSGAQVAAHLLERLGGERIVHGHSFISTFIGRASSEVTGPLSYAGGRALAIDGGIYDGGPCVIVRLDHPDTTA